MSRFAGQYRRSLTRIGRRAVIERLRVNAQPEQIQNVRVRFRDLKPEEIAGGIAAAARHIMILAEDVPEAFRPLKQTDIIRIDGRELTFTQQPDDQTHRERDLLLAIIGFVA